MSQEKERGDVEQALNELVQSTEAGITEGVRSANKRLDAMGVSIKRRAAALRKLAAEQSEDPEPQKTAPVQRQAPGPTSKTAPEPAPEKKVAERNEEIRHNVAGDKK